MLTNSFTYTNKNKLDVESSDEEGSELEEELPKRDKYKAVIDKMMDELGTRLKNISSNLSVQTILNISQKYILDIERSANLDSKIKKRVIYQIICLTIKYIDIAPVTTDNHKLIKCFSRSLKRISRYSSE